MRVAPARRSPTASSAADMTCACVPTMAPTMPAGPVSSEGADSACRSRRRAHTSAQERRGTSVEWSGIGRGSLAGDEGDRRVCPPRRPGVGGVGVT
ncbi:hypothetical protein ACFQX6_23270 [Streptosporangium lutulentum]